MAKYRANLPQLSNNLFLTDGGLETTLIFKEGLDLPDFAAFDLLKHDAGYRSLQQYFRTYASMAQENGVGLVLESATWRANPDWGNRLGYSSAALAEMNQKAIALLHDRGCCGTDDRHVEAICKACLPVFWTHLSSNITL